MKTTPFRFMTLALGLILAGCASPTASGSDSTVGAISLDKIATVGEGTYVYDTIVTSGEAAAAQSRQTFSYVDDENWANVIEQDGEVMCRARVADVVWMVAGTDCVSGPLLSVFRVPGPLPLQGFPLTEEVSGSIEWVDPQPRTAAEVEEQPSFNGTDTERTYVAELDDTTATWEVDEAIALPTTYEIDSGDMITTTQLSDIRGDPEVVLESVPDWVSRALEEQGGQAQLNSAAETGFGGL